MAQNYRKDGVEVTRYLGPNKTPRLQISVDHWINSVDLTREQLSTLKTFQFDSGPTALEANGWDEVDTLI